MSAPRILVDAVTFSRGARPVLDAVTVEVRRGEVLALVGPNGAGKSTLLHLMAGDLSPASGRVLVDGRDLAGIPVRELARLRAVLTQSNEVSFPFTVREVVSMGRAPWRGISTAEADDRLIAAALAAADIAHLAERRVPELSGGERARSAYGRVTAQDCELVLLDEPTASLDIRHQERLLGELRAHAADGGSAVVVLHDLDLAASYADRVAVLDGGRLRVCAPPAEALLPGLLSEVYRHPIAVGVDPDTGRPVVRPVRATVASAASPSSSLPSSSLPSDSRKEGARA